MIFGQYVSLLGNSPKVLYSTIDFIDEKPYLEASTEDLKDSKNHLNSSTKSTNLSIKNK